MRTDRGIHKLLSFRSAKGGSALVEFSLLLPILFSMMAGCFEFGRVFHQFHIANKGVTNAARYLARVNNPALCNPESTVFSTTDIDAARSLAQKGKFGAVDADPFIIPDWNETSTFTASTECVTNTVTSGVSTYRGPAKITKITVFTTFTYQDVGMLKLLSLLPGAPDFATTPMITATHTELYIGG